jgi:flavin-binding protein dodecin
VDDSFNFDGYQVVRGEYFAHVYEPSVTFNDYKISVNKACANRLPSVDYVQILVSRNEKKLLIKPCDEWEKGSFLWCIKGIKERRPRTATCRILFAMIMRMMEWNPGYRYKLMGKLIVNKGEYLFVFDLTEPEIYQRLLRDPETGNLILKIGSSETSVEGGDNGASARTVIDSTVRDLDVLGVFEVAEITLHVETTVPNEGRQVSMTGSAFRGVSIGGKTFDITFDDAMAAEAAADYKQFRKDHPEVLASKGEILYSLARSPELKFEPENYGYYYQPDFGRIYFAEWTAAPTRQCINMLRLQLGSPAEGRVIVLGAGNNGGWMP